MAVLRTDIERALDEFASQEEGMRFQGLAVVLAKKRWPELIARQRKKDLGLDAYAPSSLTSERIGKGLAASITPTDSGELPRTPSHCALRCQGRITRHLSHRPSPSVIGHSLNDEEQWARLRDPRHLETGRCEQGLELPFRALLSTQCDEEVQVGDCDSLVQQVGPHPFGYEPFNYEQGRSRRHGTPAGGEDCASALISPVVQDALE